MMFLSDDDPRREVWESTESPIEQYLCCALFALLGLKAVHGPFNKSILPQLAALSGNAPDCFLSAQHSTGNYRADFLAVVVNPNNRTHQRLVIECDGERYHGSDEQIARDRRRDDEIESAGYRVLRFPGASIHGQMHEIITNVRDWIGSGGVVCQTPADMELYARILFNFTPDRNIKRQREAARQSYWQRRNDEPLYFADEYGAKQRWADTL